MTIADFTTIATGQTAAFTGFSGVPIVSGNNVVFLANYNGGNGQGIFAGTVGVTGAATIADYATAALDRGVFTSFGIFSVSGAEIAFSANSYLSGTSGDTGHGLFLYRGGSLLDVAAVGESLFGSTVSSLSLATSGLDGDTLTYAYVLADGVSGVATFSAVPEPSTWALVGLRALMLVGQWKRRQV